ncbi:tudor domain-containing 6 [Menidia menidia]
MDEARKHIYEKMRQEIQTPGRKFNGSEGKPGDLCLVCISDTWHRARIVLIQSKTYNLSLVDQGKPHITTSKALAWGPSDSFLLPPEIEYCILADVVLIENKCPERLAKILMCLPGKKFNAIVQLVLMPDRVILLDMPILSKQLCKLGAATKVKVDEFEMLVQKHLHVAKEESAEPICATQDLILDSTSQLAKHEQYFYPELLTDTFETVIVTQATNPNNIFCTLLIFSKALELLSEQIHQHYEENSDFREAQPVSCGDPCACKGLDGKWHRSVLKRNIRMNDVAVEVLHVDVGKTEVINVGDVRPIRKTFLRMPVVTYHCSLIGVKDINKESYVDETEDLQSLLLDQRVVAKFEEYNKRQDVYYVTLHIGDGSCLNDTFLDETSLSLSSTTDLDATDELSSFTLSLDNKQPMDLHIEVNLTSGLPEEICQSPQNLEVNGSVGDVSNSSINDIQIKEKSEIPDHPLQENGHLSTTLPSKVHSTRDDNVLAVGECVNVNVSCIESPQRFWCQTTDSGDSLRQLMLNLQNHYSSACSQPLVESIFVARNPDNDMWYRVRVIESHDSPIVDVRFVDYGQTRKVPLRDLHPIHPPFLQLNAQAFQCCLFSMKNPTDPTTISWTDAAITEFQKFVELNTSSGLELKCTLKAVTSDEDGLRLNVVDIESESNSASKLLAQKYAQFEAQGQTPQQVPSEGYDNATHKIEVGGREKVLVTSAETVDKFYCHLQRNFDEFDKMMENVTKLLDLPQSSNHSLGLNSICLARYPDNKWYRGQVVEKSPKLKVHFVDYGDTLIVSETDVCPFSPEASVIRSVPVQAVPLGLFNVPAELPIEVNQWFTECAVGHSFTVLVVAKEEKGKLIVELFDGSLNVNQMIREKVAGIIQHKITGETRQTNQDFTDCSKRATLTNGNCSTQELEKPKEIKEQNEPQSSNGMYEVDSVSTPQIEKVKVLNNGGKPTLDTIFEGKESMCETSIEFSSIDLDTTQPSNQSDQEENEKTYTWPNISVNNTMEVYTSCIVGPQYFWCQRTNMADLNEVLTLVQEAGQVQESMITTKMLKPGSPCLALFSSDKKWYRAQVIQRTDETLRVIFVDYGNESELDISSVRSLPKSLLEKAPQAFLCCLSGFNESEGSWDENASDKFYDLLVDKPLTVTVIRQQNCPEMAVPQYAVKTVCDKEIINSIMQTHWHSFSAEPCGKGVEEAETLPQSIQIDDNVTSIEASSEKIGGCMYKVPEISKSETEMVYASCIAEPSFFWCQFSNTEDLHKVSQIAQEAGQKQGNPFPHAPGPGSLCLSLFSADNKWYRAQVIRRDDQMLHVLFVDYGNESDVDMKNVKPLPHSLLKMAPQAFLCHLNGFDESKGAWEDEAYDEFYNLLIDIPLKLTVIGMKDHSEIGVPQFSVDIMCKGESLSVTMKKYWKPLSEEHVMSEDSQTENPLQSGQTKDSRTHLCVSEKNVETCMFKDPIISRNQTEMVFASSIAEPHFFWCQFAHTEELHKLSQLAQESGQALQDSVFSQTIGPGSPCLALFSSENQWYRAKVIGKVDQTLSVLFVDYGNESEVDIKNVRPLPECLLEAAPQAFLCCLNGFDKSKGSWDEKVYDDFYYLLVDKLLKLKVFGIGQCLEISVAQYAVEIECEGVVVNVLMEKYWKAVDTESVVSANQDETKTNDEDLGV